MSSSIEEKVDMSLDELVALRKKEQPARRAKTTTPKPDKRAVQSTANKMKRQNKINQKRGLATSKETPAQVQKKAVKVTLKKATAKPKTFSIEPTAASRPVSIKDFVLPPDTKMTISFTTTKGKTVTVDAAATKSPAKKKTKPRIRSRTKKAT